MKRYHWLLAAALVGLVACSPPHLTYNAVSQSPPQLVVQGDASIEAVPDLLQLRLGVVTQDADADQAMAQNNQRMAAVMEQLVSLGIAKENLSTGQFRVQPEWSVPPRPTPANWQRSIIGYRVSNELLVETGQVDLAGKLLAASQSAGANQIGGLQFALTDPKVQRQQAIAEAVAEAIGKAKVMATSAGVKLGKLQSMTLSPPAPSGGPMLIAEARMAGPEAVPVAAGRVEVSASVTMTYQLLPLPTASE